MAGRPKLAAQVLAVALVAGLFAILTWKLATQEEGAAPKLQRGQTPVAPAFQLDRLDRSGKISLAAYRGRPVVRRSQPNQEHLLGPGELCRQERGQPA